MKYGYTCLNCGIIEVEVAADTFVCLECGSIAKRLRSFAVDKPSLKTQARWDPIVGQYVRNDAEFRSLLAAGQERESAELNMDVRLTTLDARDQEGLAELHGHSTAERQHEREMTERAASDKANA